VVEGWRFSGDVAAVLMVVSELVTNAVMHGEGQVDVAVRLDSDGVRVEVLDQGTEGTFVAQVPTDAPGGRGLAIVQAFSSDWGFQQGPGGVRVWASITASGGEPITGK
jgi:anti-sigma regulatory factor (Ser/Thr protein kinase)